MATSAIQATGGDYTTPWAWEADQLATLTENTYGEMADEAFTSTSTKTFTGVNAAGFDYILRPQTGAGHKDTSQALIYSTTGARVVNTTTYADLLFINNAGLTVEYIQATNTDSGNYARCIEVSNGLILGCIAESDGSRCMQVNNDGIMANCLAIVNKVSGVGYTQNYVYSSGKCVGCTAVVPSSVTSTTGVGFNNGGNVDYCLSIGFNTDFSGTFSGDYNGSDSTGAPGANATDNIVAADCFVNDDGDYKLKSGSAAIGAGNTDSTYPLDILGTTRGTTTDGDIGCHEFVGAGAAAAEWAKMNSSIPPGILYDPQHRFMETRQGETPEAVPTIKHRRTIKGLGTRIGSRQLH